MATPSISVVIINYNTCDLLKKCLDSIFETKGNLAIEVFVADNNSTDGSYEMVKARFPEVALITYQRNVGYTKAVNLVLALTKGAYCLLLHPDVEMQPNTLRELIDFFESHPDAGIVGGNLYYPDGTPNPCEILFPSFRNNLACFTIRLFRKVPGGRKLIGDYNPFEWSHESTSRVNWVWNACMMVRREVFEGIGYFDEDFYVWYADWDLCKRAADSGWAAYYLHPAIAIHHERQSYGKEEVPTKNVRYKVDGWYSADRQIKDRYVFLRKHTTRSSTYGIKAINIVENTLRPLVISANLLFRKAILKDASFQVRTCLRTIRTILKA